MIESCTCKALMRPRWTRDEPKAFVCQRCGRPVPGYEELWWAREQAKRKALERQDRRG